MKCSICGKDIAGTMVGTGDGNGQSFAHKECYELSKGLSQCPVCGQCPSMTIHQFDCFQYGFCVIECKNCMAGVQVLAKEIAHCSPRGSGFIKWEWIITRACVLEARRRWNLVATTGSGTT